MAQRNATSSPFLRLPPEIRNMIYTHIIDVVTVVFTKAGLGRGRHPVQDGLALVRVCRQIHAEAGLLPYALNTFVFWTFTSVLRVFLDRRKEEQIAVMRNVLWGSEIKTAGEWMKVLRKPER
ncbi:hypothetical protein IG631_14329 [Alternaria alternata]|nr:hypothetical protein IG631_14329 [Alternaria alternata]